MDKIYQVRPQLKERKNTNPNRFTENISFRICDVNNDSFETINLIPLIDADQIDASGNLGANPPKILTGISSRRILEI